MVWVRNKKAIKSTVSRFGKTSTDTLLLLLRAFCHHLSNSQSHDCYVLNVIETLCAVKLQSPRTARPSPCPLLALHLYIYPGHLNLDPGPDSLELDAEDQARG